MWWVRGTEKAKRAGDKSGKNRRKDEGRDRKVKKDKKKKRTENEKVQ